jgi:hypothetical protein
MARVFVVQESRYKQKDGTYASHDYSSLYRYGPVEFLLPATRKQMDELEGVDELALLNQKLEAFNADVDYLVFSGDPVLCGLAAIVVYSLTEHPRLQVLKWNRKDGIYEPVEVPLP